MPKTGLTAQWNAGRIAQVRARVGKDVGVEVGDALTRIRDDWAANVHVDTRHMQQEIESAHITFKTATSGTVEPRSVDEYFYYQEFGTYKMAANPAMRQAQAKEAARLADAIRRVIDNAINGTG